MRRDAVIGWAMSVWGCVAIAWSPSAHAQQEQQDACATDQDCGPDSVCAVVDLPPPTCPSGRACPAPKPPLGICVEDNRCGSDQDCAPDEQCTLVEQPPAACPRGQSCPASAAPAREGTCEPRPMICETAADCAAGLSCESPVCLPAAGSAPAPCDQPSTCVLRLQNCASDTECGAGFGCIAAGGRSCESRGVACRQGEPCPPPVEHCSEPERLCFPRRVDCMQTSDCEEGWRCVTLPDKGGPPEYLGAKMVCFPEGFALALEERVEVLDSKDQGPRAGNRVSAMMGAADAPAPASNLGAAMAPAADSAKEAAASKPGGCAVGPGVGRDADRDVGGWLVCAGLLALTVRRRRSGSCCGR